MISDSSFALLPFLATVVRDEDRTLGTGDDEVRFIFYENTVEGGVGR